MSSKAMGLALEQPLDPVPKLTLVTLADALNIETAKCTPSQGFIAQRVRRSVKTVASHLDALEAGGYITRHRRTHPVTGHRLSDGYELHVDDWPGLREETSRRANAKSASGYKLEAQASEPNHKEQRSEAAPPRSDRTSSSDEASEDPNVATTREARPRTQRERATRARAAADKLPAGYPDELRPHAEQAHRVLSDVAEQWNAREVTLRGVGLAIMGNPNRRFVAEAYALASWAQSPGRTIKDVVSSYRTWLGRSAGIAGVERLDGGPAPGAARRNGRGGWTARDMFELGEQAAAEQEGAHT